MRAGSSLEPASFDVVLYRLVLHHIAYQGPLAPCFAEAAALLRPGGSLVAIEPGLWHPIGAALSIANQTGTATAAARHARRHPAVAAAADRRGPRRWTRARAACGHLRLATAADVPAASAAATRPSRLAPARGRLRSHADADRPVVQVISHSANGSADPQTHDSRGDGSGIGRPTGDAVIAVCLAAALIVLAARHYRAGSTSRSRSRPPARGPRS